MKSLQPEDQPIIVYFKVFPKTNLKLIWIGISEFLRKHPGIIDFDNTHNRFCPRH